MANARQEATTSLWVRSKSPPPARRLTRDTTCDVVVIGAGIAGLSAAYELSQVGQNVVVIDRGSIAGGVTSRTTAHLAPVCDDGVAQLIEARGEDVARLFQRSQEAAVDRIEEIIKSYRIACDFRRLDAFLFPAIGMDSKKARDQLEQEYSAVRKVGVRAERVKGVPLQGREDAPALRYPDQATFHPLRYIDGLLGALRRAGAHVFADSPVIEVQESTTGVRIRTKDAVIDADYAIVATNSPINDQLTLSSKMTPYRSYVIAYTIEKNMLPDALYWDNGDPYHYVRLSRGPGTVDYLIAGGADQKTGEADDGEVRFEAVDAWIRSLLPALGREVTRWSGQILDTEDYCGYIGRYPGNKRIFVATGDSGQGMTHGALAGILLRDLIVKGENEWSAVYDPARAASSTLTEYARKMINAVTNAGASLMPGDRPDLEKIESGDGGIYRTRDGTAVAVCRDRKGKLHTVSPTCTHAGCDLRWNSTEQCWDCPCHGSQFAPDGTVLGGPATAPLKRIALGG